MKYISLLVLFAISLNSYSTENKESSPQIRLITSEVDMKLKKNESQYIFEFDNLIKFETDLNIRYSIDATESTEKLDSTNRLYVKTTPGKHIFQFYVDDRYFEIYSDSLEISPQHTNNYLVSLKSSEYPTALKKPVIYLYPLAEINFSVKVYPNGKLSFTYPTYNDEWNGVAYPNGDLLIQNKLLNYLFWESDQTINLNLIETNKGAIVKGDESQAFLENQLSVFGLNSKEKADFMTFWAPQLQQNEFNYIHFVLNNDADYFAELSVKPEPDAVYRFYILTCPVANPSDFNYLQPQLVEPIHRMGFTVIEWGGSVIDMNLIKNRIPHL